MIASLSGRVDQLGSDSAVIDVGGVGYLTFCSTRTLGQLGPLGSPARLLVETHVREDHIHLYGFVEAAERDWFRLLTTVQGVGARVALSILSVASADQLTLAIMAQDKSALTRADGVGPKLGARIVNELRDKVSGLAAAPAGMPAANRDVSAMAGLGPSSDAVSALVNLGYRRAEAFSAVATAARELGEAATTDALIRAGLKELVQQSAVGREITR